MTDDAPRLWHPSRSGRFAALVARQGIFALDGAPAGHELLFRAAGHEGDRPDLWPLPRQDRATEHVIAAAFHRGEDPCAGLPAFVNFTHTYLLGHDGTMGCDPARVVIEVLETAHDAPPLLGRLERLRDLGFRIALDDFTDTPAQRALLPLADLVKIDLRDLAVAGERLVDAARSRGATLIAERVEDDAMLASCRHLGFGMAQGYGLEHPVLLDRGVHRHDTDTLDDAIAAAV